LIKLNSTSRSELTSQYIWFLLWNVGHDLAVGVVVNTIIDKLEGSAQEC
jgi:hypothetical protein